MYAVNIPISLSQKQMDAIALVYVSKDGSLWLVDAHGNDICNDWINEARDADTNSRVKEHIKDWSTDGISFSKPS